MEDLCSKKRIRIIETTNGLDVSGYVFGTLETYTYEKLKSIMDNAFWFLEGKDSNLITVHFFSNAKEKEIEFIVCNFGSDIFDCLKINTDIISKGGYTIKNKSNIDIVNPELDVFKQDLVSKITEIYRLNTKFNQYKIPQDKLIKAMDSEFFVEKKYQDTVDKVFDKVGITNTLKFFIDEFRNISKNIRNYRVNENAYLPDSPNFDPLINDTLFNILGINSKIPIERYSISKEDIEYYQIKEKEVNWVYGENSSFCGIWNALVDTGDGIAMLLPSLYDILTDRALFKKFFRLIIDLISNFPKLKDLITEYDLENSSGSIYKYNYQQCYEMMMLITLFLPIPKIGKGSKASEVLEYLSQWLAQYSAKSELITLAYKVGLRVEKTADEWKLIFGKYTLLKGKKEKILRMVEDLGEISKFEEEKNLTRFEKLLDEAVVEENGLQRKLTKAEKEELLKKLRYKGGAFGSKSVVETTDAAKVKAFEEGEIQFVNKTIAKPFDKIKEAISYFNHHVVGNIVEQVGENNCGNVVKVIAEYLRTGELKLAEWSGNQGLVEVAEKCGAGRFGDITGLDRLEFLLRDDEIAILYGARKYHSSGLVEGHYLVAVKVEKKVYLLEGQTGEILLYDKTSMESKNFERGYKQFKYTKAGKIKN